MGTLKMYVGNYATEQGFLTSVKIVRFSGGQDSYLPGAIKNRKTAIKIYI